MERVRDPPLHRAACGDQRLGCHEAAEDAWPAVVRAEATKEIEVERLEIEPLEEAVEFGHVAELARQFDRRRRMYAAVPWTPTPFRV